MWKYTKKENITIKSVSIDTSVDLVWQEANCMQSPHYNRYIISILTDSQSLWHWETPCDEFSTAAVSEELWSAGWVVQITEEAQEEICDRRVCEYQLYLWGIELLHHFTSFTSSPSLFTPLKTESSLKTGLGHIWEACGRT